MKGMKHKGSADPLSRNNEQDLVAAILKQELLT